MWIVCQLRNAILSPKNKEKTNPDLPSLRTITHPPPSGKRKNFVAVQANKSAPSPENAACRNPLSITDAVAATPAGPDPPAAAADNDSDDPPPVPVPPDVIMPPPLLLPLPGFLKRPFRTIEARS